jgi:hypothetical protein
LRHADKNDDRDDRAEATEDLEKLHHASSEECAVTNCTIGGSRDRNREKPWRYSAMAQVIVTFT